MSGSTGNRLHLLETPAQAGVRGHAARRCGTPWIPAVAGMTSRGPRPAAYSDFGVAPACVTSWTSAS